MMFYLMCKLILVFEFLGTGLMAHLRQEGMMGHSRERLKTCVRTAENWEAVSIQPGTPSGPAAFTWVH